MFSSNPDQSIDSLFVCLFLFCLTLSLWTPVLPRTQAFLEIFWEESKSLREGFTEIARRQDSLKRLPMIHCAFCVEKRGLGSSLTLVIQFLSFSFIVVVFWTRLNSRNDGQLDSWGCFLSHNKPFYRCRGPDWSCKERAAITREQSFFICILYGRDCYGRVGLHSHFRERWTRIN